MASRASRWVDHLFRICIFICVQNYVYICICILSVFICICVLYLICVWSPTEPGEFDFLPESFALPKERAQLYQVKKSLLVTFLTFCEKSNQGIEQLSNESFEDYLVNKLIKWSNLMIINWATNNGKLQKCLEKKIEREIISSLFGGFILLAPIEALYAMEHF